MLLFWGKFFHSESHERARLNLTAATMKPAQGVSLGQLPSYVRICVRQAHSGRPRRATKGFVGPEGHGEHIWVFGHRRTDQIIYSFDEKLDVSPSNC